MKKIIILSAALLGFNLASNAQTGPVTAAQTATANQNVVLSLNNAIAITFVSTGASYTGSDVTLTFNNVADYQNGVTSAPQHLFVQSNRPFKVSANTTGTTFAFTNGAAGQVDPGMPVHNVLNAKVSNATSGSPAGSFGSFASLENGSQDILTGCSNGGNEHFDVTYKATPGFLYPGGTYTTNVVYTATQN